jgi:ribosomal protein S18 acetylase RimI-like enzyme
LVVRSFEGGDAKAVWALHDVALNAAGVHGGRGPWEDDLRDIWGVYLEPGGDFVVAFLGGDLVGMGGLLRLSDEDAEIKRMRIHPDHQRRGFGRTILKALEDRAAYLGFRELSLDTTEEQRAAQRLYEDSGYTEIGRRRSGPFLFIDYRKRLRRG